ncbi:GyrI-like domain-containing protein [Brevibacillus sp. B_LB10_24]|uniref:GyrI-like domain-containing protein n=1 Tax=Brevibacillus sp. B_LB10_24 TaxID=3380645 RepID=UPI0038B78C86
MEKELVKKNAFSAVGVIWQGTFQQAASGEIRNVMEELRSRIKEITQVVNPEAILGISFHNIPNGFTYHLCMETTEGGTIPEGMQRIDIPALTYVTCKHERGKNVNDTYTDCYRWIEEQGYILHESEYKQLEVYPVSYRPLTDEPEFIIMIPVKEALI